MNYSIKLLLPVGLGALAALLNFVVLSSNARPVEYVTVSRTIEAGEMISPEDLTPLELPAQFEKQLAKTAVAFRDKAILSGQIARRTIEQGDIILYQDTPQRGPALDLLDGETAIIVPMGRNAPPGGVLEVGQQVSFRIPVSTADGEALQWVGPFRLVTVGSQRSVRLGGDDSSSRVDQVSVAFVAEGATRQKMLAQSQLEAYLDRLRNGESVELAVRAHASPL